MTMDNQIPHHAGAMYYIIKTTQFILLPDSADYLRGY